MSVQHSHTAVAEEPLTLAAAYDHLYETALRPSPIATIGLELEGHLVDLHAPADRVGWDRITALRSALPTFPGGSDVTTEPGGQIELSAPPRPVSAAIAAMRQDEATLRSALAEIGLGVARIGTDPARRAARVNPEPRYAAMETHFGAIGQLRAGKAMMCSTAALQLNLDAGPAAGWADRVQLAHRLGPVLIALSACSPLLAGRFTGWRSSRQRVWNALDAARCGPILGRDGVDPAEDWARYALRAPVMLVRDGETGGAEPVRGAVPFESWVAGRIRLGDRSPTLADLDYHATTLFPPVRLRGFLELRYLDAVPTRWWPALAAITTALMDDPVASAVAAEAAEPVAGRWLTAAREGLGDPELRRAAVRCTAAAATVVPAELSADVAAFAERAEAGRDLGADLAERARRDGALAVLEEEARA